jgi:hypothetical protein
MLCFWLFICYCTGDGGIHEYIWFVYLTLNLGYLVSEGSSVVTAADMLLWGTHEKLEFSLAVRVMTPT